MSKRRSWARVAVGGASWTLASVLVLAGCSGDADGRASEPITLGSMLGVPAPGSEDPGAEQQQIEEAIAACMANEGWDYIPVQYPDVDITGLLETSEEDARERLEREGLGISYNLLYPDAGSTSINDPYADWVNPNDAYVATLSEDEKVAYEESLYGTAEEQAASTVTEWEFDPYTGGESGLARATSGCSGESYDAVASADAAPPSEYWDQMKLHYFDIQSRIEADPRTIPLSERWAACMRDQGYSFGDRDVYNSYIHSDIQSKANAIAGVDPLADPTAGWSQDEIDDFFATATEEEVAALFSPPRPELTGGQRAELEDLLEREIHLGLSNLDCSEGIESEAAEIAADVEEDYVLEHEAELVALAAMVPADD